MIDPNHPIHPTVAGANRSGLTVREHFAARALQGIVASVGLGSPASVALAAVEHADDLIEALNADAHKQALDAVEDVPPEWSPSKLADEREAFEEWAQHAQETRYIDYNQAWLGWLAAKGDVR